MEYLVEVSPAALAEAEAAYQWIANSSQANAARWFNGLLDAIISLESNPRRCSLARESGLLPAEVRQLVYGLYRILFVV